MSKLTRRVVRFGISGIITTAVAYATFIGFLRFVPYFSAATASWLLSVLLGFLLNRRFTFGIRGAERRVADGVRFFVGACLQYGIAMSGYALLIGWLHLMPTAAFAINLVFTTSFSFTFMSLVAFRRPRPSAAASPNAL